MTYLWDTHALIWAMEGDPQLPERARRAAEERNEHAVCGVSLWEVACLVHLGRIRLSIRLEDWMDAVMQRLPVLNITGHVAARCYDLGDFHGDPADRIIAATSLVHGLTLVTRDGKLQKHPGLVTLWE
jgi:PIN domain nuclease of toxin-antitoxin system